MGDESALQRDMKKHAANFLGFVKLAAIRLWLRVYETTT